jgi:hypothetical protein
MPRMNVLLTSCLVLSFRADASAARFDRRILQAGAGQVEGAAREVERGRTSVVVSYVRNPDPRVNPLFTLMRADSGWFRNAAKKRAGYAGHTDIGTLTYLYANPVAGLQVYGPTGWEHVSYVPNSLLVNAGDAMEYVTRGLFNATLHRCDLCPPPTLVLPALTSR